MLAPSIFIFRLSIIFLYLFIEQTYCVGTWQTLNLTCDHSQTSNDCSSALKKVMAEAKEKSSVFIDINIPQILLDFDLNFTNLSSLTISGQSNKVTITCNNIGVGIVLRDVNTVILSNFSMTFCGSLVDHENDKYKSALTAIGCTNVEINRITMIKNEGLGLFIVNHLSSRVSIDSTTFKENKLLQENNTSLYMGGGGVYIKFDNISLNQKSVEPTTVQFNNCIFAYNTAHTVHYNTLYTDALGHAYAGYGQGGGVYVVLRNGLNNVWISFLSCNFTGNQAYLGGGLAIKTVEKSGQSKSIKVEIRDTVFIRNGCDKTTDVTGFGGGAHLTLDTSDKSGSISDCHYMVRNTNFTGNCAKHGGGVYYYSSKQSFNSTTNSMFFNNCTFARNRAHLGSAIIVTPSIYFRLSTGHSVIPTFLDCLFLNNSVHKRQKTYGFGTVYVSSYDILFHGMNIFEYNWGSALYIVNGVANFQNSSARFTNNTGLKGGAIAIVGSSTMIVGPHKYEFISNTAIYQGGAILVLPIDRADYTGSRRCFIQYLSNTSDILFKKWDSHIRFIGNRAKDKMSGNAIYATSLFPCLVTGNDTESMTGYTVIENFSHVLTHKGDYITFDETESLQPQIVTDGASLTRAESSPMMLIPGKKHKHNIVTTDEFNNKVNASFRVAIEQYSKIHPDPALSTYIGSKIQLRGNPGAKGTLILQTVSSRESYIQLEVELTNCPPGFALNDDLECECNVEAYVGLYKCKKFDSYLIPGYWAGFINVTNNKLELVTSSFPFDSSYDYSTLADKSTGFKLGHNPYHIMSDTVCGDARTGIACGICLDNYTAHFNSPDFLCKPAEPFGCKLGWIFYILAELIPVTLVFIMVLVLNISFTSGAINGFILYSQLLVTLDIDASGIIALPFPKHLRINQVYQLLYGYFNVDFFYFEFFSFCLWKHASSLDMLAFKYVTIVYTLILIAVVIWIMNKCGGRWLGKCCRITTIKTSVINGISTFLTICYTQCVRTSLGLLIPLHVHVNKNSTYKQPLRVWFNGELIYFSRGHLPYALPAIFCLLTVGLLPPVLLLSYPLLNKVLATLGLEDHKTASIISCNMSRIKPLLDAFQGCFKDNLRFFAGLYFLYRWTILLIYISVEGFSMYYPAVNGTLIFILTLHTVCQPYTKRANNIIDALLFANLLLINSLSYYNYHISFNWQKVGHSDITSSVIAQQVLIFLPLVVVGYYILTMFCRVMINHGCEGKIAAVEMVIPGKTIKLRKILQNISDSDSSDEYLTDERLMDEDIEYNEYSGLGVTQFDS